MQPENSNKAEHFIEHRIQADLAAGKIKQLITRFPPEPNGYLHIGHAKSICLNFTLADKYNGQCHLRFDDTNPVKEDLEYVKAIQADIQWLGFNWGKHLYHTSDYFEALYQAAMQLIKAGKAYVCRLSLDEIKTYRGTLQTPGKASPYREQSIDDNLKAFEQMRAGEFKEGECVLRAKIDMSAGNINLRDPIIYRIKHVTHQNTQTAWCIYPMYDFSHALSDALEHITHSLCTLEFQDHRPLYDWFVDNTDMPHHPQQIEFSRLNLSHTITSKRKLKLLVDEHYVNGWDDPRLPTLIGMRNRGYPPQAIRQFCLDIGVSKSESVLPYSLLEDYVRNYLNDTAVRAMCVLNPLKIIITNYPDNSTESLNAACHPNHPELGTRTLPFSREIYIEQDDFMEQPVPKYHRLAPGKEVRLRNAYVIQCTDVIKDEQGNVIECHCTYDPKTLGKKPEGRKVKGVIHWVEAHSAVPATVALYDRLFSVENPANADDFLSTINPNSLTLNTHALVEPSLQKAPVDQSFQFERLGYFIRKPNQDKQLSFYKIVNLRDTWIKKSN